MINELTRRELLGVTALMATSFSHANDKKGKDDKASPKMPFRSVNVPEDGRRILMFFDFSCPYCAQYHEPMVRWTQTTPKSVKTLFVPVVNAADKVRMSEQVLAAKCYYAAYSIGSQEQIIRFVTSIYQSQQSGFSLTSSRVWVDALKFSGINNKRFSEAVKGKSFDPQVQMSAWKTKQYSLVATPSVAVGGRYVLIPDDVNGDPQMFFNILNGLTSEIV